eukprot:m.374844 g.374844  ORF g.374844 m.374844 type:complete len:88 (-) comp16692_c0_seq16:1819-2082(-)
MIICTSPESFPAQPHTTSALVNSLVCGTWIVTRTLCPPDLILKISHTNPNDPFPIQPAHNLIPSFPGGSDHSPAVDLTQGAERIAKH